MCGACTHDNTIKMSSRPIRPVERQRMRPWLENLLNNRSVDGLKWTDQKMKIFEIPWRHGSRHGWNQTKDADLFERWAKHTGRFEKGKPNPKKWKANFRCALHSLTDVKEVTPRKTDRESKCTRVYQFVDDTKQKEREGRRPYRRRKLSSESDISSKYSADSCLTSSPSSTTKYTSDDDVSSSSPEYSITRDAKKRKMDEDLTKHSSYKKYTCIEKNDVKSNKLKYSPQHAAFQEPTKDQISPLPDSTSQLDFNILLDGIKKERIDTEVTEITLPFKPTLGDNFEIEIDRGVFLNHMSGFIMIQTSGCINGFTGPSAIDSDTKTFTSNFSSDFKGEPSGNGTFLNDSSGDDCSVPGSTGTSPEYTCL
ncbi:interferon regulatory factor 2 [Mytilus galloprovincialis]|uniref:Interferon regulatory factor 2 n=1 Tax=Mytilus galloprovincialis TaxID=29158 RepID=A0A8B6HRG7_MYTGA|nr:interferon regulatory factor 2 [Mytilus galloprovincialis]